MPEPKDNKIKILFLASSPTDVGRIGLDREHDEIDQKLRVGNARDSFELISHFAVRPERLQEFLLRDQPHVVHFCGHGNPSEEILLMDKSGVSRPVTKAALTGLFTTLKDNIRIIVLNSSYSKPQAEALSQVVDYTIGTTKEIGDEAAIEFAAAFYQGLSFGRSVDDAFKLGKNMIDLKNQSGSERVELLVRDGVNVNEPFLQQQLRYESGLTSNQISGGANVMTKPKDDKIKILLFSANPAGTGTLKLDEETREIMAKVRASGQRDRIQIVTAVAVRPDDLLQAMNENEPHVVQFSGHGSQDEGILICDEKGDAKAIGGEALAALFESTEKNVQVVVLNACYSKPQAEAIAAVVPCVVAMKDTIGDRAARVFAASFYSALGFGHSVERAFKQGLTRLKLENIVIEGVAQSDIPILITRSHVKASDIVPVNP